MLRGSTVKRLLGWIRGWVWVWVWVMVWIRGEGRCHISITKLVVGLA